MFFLPLYWKVHLMTNQGLWGAIEQYWTVEEKPRLHRRNTFFEDNLDKVTNYDALCFSVGVTVLAVAIIVFWTVVGGLII